MQIELPPPAGLESGHLKTSNEIKIHACRPCHLDEPWLVTLGTTLSELKLRFVQTNECHLHYVFHILSQMQIWLHVKRRLKSVMHTVCVQCAYCG